MADWTQAGLWLGVGTKLVLDAIPSAFGAVVTLKFLPVSLSRNEKIFSVLCSYGIGTYFGRGLAAYLNFTNGHVIDFVVFGFAIFGLSFVGTIMSEIKPIFILVTRRWISTVTLIEVKKEDTGDTK